MVVPLLFQKMLHDNFIIWSVRYHYNIEFAPILSMGCALAISKFRNLKRQKYAMVFILMFSAIATIKFMDPTIINHRKENIRFYQRKHYFKNYDTQYIRNVIGEVPKNAIVSAQDPFVAHLSLRQKIYSYPIVKDAEYILLHAKEDPFPLDAKEFEAKIMELKKNQKWRNISPYKDVYLFKKVSNIR